METRGADGMSTAGAGGGDAMETENELGARIGAAAELALRAVEAELRAALEAQEGGGRAELRQLKDAAALLKELLALTRELGAGAARCVTVRFKGEDVAAAGE